MKTSNGCLLDEDTTRRLLKQAQSGDQNAVETLLQHNQRFIQSIARKYYHPERMNDLELDDLVQLGSIGFCMAIQRWDDSKENRFSTYAYYWVRAYIRREALKSDAGTSVSYRFSEKLMEFRRVYSKVFAEQGREPTVRELVDATGMPEDEVGLAILSIQSGFSHSPRLSDDGEELDEGETIPSEVNVESDAIHSALLSEVELIVAQMPKKYQTVMAHRFSLWGQPEMTQRELSKKMGVAFQRVQKIEKKALDHLRQQLTNSRLL